MSVDLIDAAARDLVETHGFVSDRVQTIVDVLSRDERREKVSLDIFERAFELSYRSLVSDFGPDVPDQQTDLSCYAKIVYVDLEVFRTVEFDLSFLRDSRFAYAVTWRNLQSRRYFAEAAVFPSTNSIFDHVSTLGSNPPMLDFIGLFNLDVNLNSLVYQVGPTLEVLEQSKRMVTKDPFIFIQLSKWSFEEVQRIFRTGKIPPSAKWKRLQDLQTLMFLLDSSCVLPPFRPKADNKEQCLRSALQILLCSQRWYMPQGFMRSKLLTILTMLDVDFNIDDSKKKAKASLQNAIYDITESVPAKPYDIVMYPALRPLVFPRPERDAGNPPPFISKPPDVKPPDVEPDNKPDYNSPLRYTRNQPNSGKIVVWSNQFGSKTPRTNILSQTAELPSTPRKQASSRTNIFSQTAELPSTFNQKSQSPRPPLSGPTQYANTAYMTPKGNSSRSQTTDMTNTQPPFGKLLFSPPTSAQFQNDFKTFGALQVKQKTQNNNNETPMYSNQESTEPTNNSSAPIEYRVPNQKPQAKRKRQRLEEQQPNSSKTGKIGTLSQKKSVRDNQPQSASILPSQQRTTYTPITVSSSQPLTEPSSATVLSSNNDNSLESVFSRLNIDEQEPIERSSEEQFNNEPLSKTSQPSSAGTSSSLINRNQSKVRDTGTPRRFQSLQIMSQENKQLKDENILLKKEREETIRSQNESKNNILTKEHEETIRPQNKDEMPEDPTASDQVSFTVQEQPRNGDPMTVDSTEIVQELTTEQVPFTAQEQPQDEKTDMDEDY